ncbi:porin [Rugamonas sp. CCM 8940]|uniref:porin n=1 Tax=Rugamonas sp. CCM 8940 TaxID=2765359 RepID=UPI0018F2A0A5|nr:porin [Rugamonas sp. CCM 8940]MBJ7312133.1 porin [Rugamonas sp. CCM 8940]
MKKSIISIAILGAMSNVAFAQSNVTIYGIVDAGIVSERGGKAGSVTKVTSGVGSASRLGFKGTEDLGGGLNAVFVLESGIKADTGESDVAGSIANRQSYVGLKSATAGSLTLGRQYTPYYNTLSQVADPFAAGLAGSAKNLFMASGNNTRTSNSVVYATPALNGFTAEAAYALGEQSGDNSASRQLGLSVGYANGPLTARAAFNSRNNDTTAPTTPVVNTTMGHNALLAVNYDFAVAKAFFAYGKDKGNFSSIAPKDVDSSEILVGATAPVGPAGTLMASFIRKNDKLASNQDADQWAIGYSHALSKRTSTYVAYAKIKNKNGATYTVGNNSEVGTGDKAFNIGVKHAF